MSRQMVQRRNVSDFDETDQRGWALARNNTGVLPSGLTTSYQAAGSEPISCDATQVALVDEIVLTSLTKDDSTAATANTTITIKANGIEMPFHFVGQVDVVRNETMIWKPSGHFVVQPSQTLTAKSNVNGGANGLLIRYRKKSLIAAIRDGDISGNATLPNVASTNAVAGGGTAAATAKAIVAASAGEAIEILGFVFTGHNYNAASDDIRIGFWDGVTGTFAANGAMVMRAYRRGASARWAQPIIVGDTNGCIQGALGAGVYIQASTNMAGATPTADWNILYRKVRANNVASTTGTCGATPVGKKKWWCYSEVIPGGAILSSTRFFPVDMAMAPVLAQSVVIRGYAGSSTTGSQAATICAVGLGLGDYATQISEIYFTNGDLAAGAATTSNVWARENMQIVVAQTLNPCFYETEGTANQLVTYSQLAWGKFKQEAPRLVGSAIYPYTNI